MALWGAKVMCETNFFSVGNMLKSVPYSLSTNWTVSTPIASIPAKSTPLIRYSAWRRGSSPRFLIACAFFGLLNFGAACPRHSSRSISASFPIISRSYSAMRSWMASYIFRACPSVNKWSATPEMERMAAWLKERNVESVAMEATGVYWVAPHEVLERTGLEVVLENVSLMTRAKTMFDLPRAIAASSRMLSEFDPEVVIGVGGYASGPAMVAAIRRRLPTLAFEPNVVPGFANRMIARWVSAAAVHFEETCRYFPNCRVTGVPVRLAFFAIPPKTGGTPTLLVFGGSQGARAINQAVIESLAGLRARIPGIHIIHQTGQRDYEHVLAAYQASGISGEVHKFIDDMPGTFGRADLLVCRSGASTVGEITDRK